MIRLPPRSTLFPYTRSSDLLVMLQKNCTSWVKVDIFRAKRIGFPNGESNDVASRSEEHTSELQSRQYLVCRLLLEKKKHRFTHVYVAELLPRVWRARP